MQHADHFTRVLNEKRGFRRDKFYESKSENNKDISEEHIENSDKDLGHQMMKLKSKMKKVGRNNLVNSKYFSDFSTSSFIFLVSKFSFCTF